MENKKIGNYTLTIERVAGVIRFEITKETTKTNFVTLRIKNYRGEIERLEIQTIGTILETTEDIEEYQKQLQEAIETKEKIEEIVMEELA